MRHTTPLSIHSRMRGEGVNTRKGPRKLERLSYEIGVEVVERTNEDGIHFVVHRNTAALAPTGEGTLDDDLVAFLHGHPADDLQRACSVTQEKLKCRTPLFISDRLDLIHLAHDDHFLPVVVLRMGNHFGQLHQLGPGGSGKE